MRYLFISILSLILFSACGDDENGMSGSAQPKLNIGDIEVEESDDNKGIIFMVRADRASEDDITFSYSTVSGTAEGGLDFIEVQNQTATIAAGRTSVSLEIVLRGDQLEESSEEFSVEISNATNASIDKSTGIATIADDDLVDFSDIEIPTTGYDTPDNYEGMTLVWEDQFTSSSLNTSDWNYEIGNGASGWGNNELQYYREDNTFMLADDYMVIEAKQENFGGFNYTSSRLTTQGKKEFKYGRIDVRAVLPEGQGIWPAIWMLGSNFGSAGWPACGEIDIMELVGHQPGVIHSTVHYGINFANHQYDGRSFTLNSGEKFSDEFHVFSLVWEEDYIQFLMDDQEVFEVTPVSLGGGASYPFNQEFFFIFNIAVGGNWPQSPDNTTTFPQRMIVDYIRVFQ